MKSQKKTSTKGLEAKKAESNKAVYSKIDKFPIVAIGVSAGGLEALEEFFGNMPKNSGMAFVVIQHLDPHHKVMMSELLQRITEMKVTTATDSLKVKPNSVYVIPLNKSISILNDVSHLFKPIQTNGLRLPINFFFRSLALDRLEQSIERRMGIHQIGEIVSYVHFLRENPAEAEIVFGRKHNDVTSKNYFDLFIPKQLREKVISDMKQLLNGDFPNKFESHVKAIIDGLLKIEWTNHKLLNKKGDLTETIAIGENVTDK